MTQVADPSELLRSRGHRVTRARLAVWSVLTDDGGHLTVEEIAEQVQAREPGTNLASVYRALTLFEELDLVRASRLPDEGQARWELAHPDEHFHLVCEECGAIEHHVGALVEQVREHLAAGHGYEPRSVELIVRGRCPRCIA
ncbi:MAG TPA: Fur family transcriptional regulator [Egibacteraceae bacterium]|nr:Fur family transcriptional regulator [Egibacteraceae bacterium]